jgi:hypothetical protein
MEKCIESIVECNLYQYTGNNPVNRVDLTGEIWLLPNINNKNIPNTQAFMVQTISNTALEVGGKVAYQSIKQTVAKPYSILIDTAEAGYSIVDRTLKSENPMAEIGKIIVEEAVGKAVSQKVKFIGQLILGSGNKITNNISDKLASGASDGAKSLVNDGFAKMDQVHSQKNKATQAAQATQINHKEAD